MSDQTEEKLTFESEEAKLAAMQEMSDKLYNGEMTGEEADNALAQFDEAEIVSGSDNKEADIDSVEANEVNDGPAQPADESTQPEQTVYGDHTSELYESFKGLSPDNISKETYFDPISKRTKRFITHKDFGSFQDSYISAQKHINYLKTNELPAQFEAGKKAAEQEFQAKIKELEDKIANQSAQPAPQQQFNQPQQKNEEISGDLELLSINPEADDFDVYDGFKKANENVSKLAGYIKNLTSKHEQELEKIRNESKSYVDDYAQQLKQKQDEDLAYEAQKAAIQKSYDDMNAFTKSDLGKQLGLSGNIPFEVMETDAQSFRKDLARVYYGPNTQITREMEFGAEAAYLSGQPAMVQRVNEAGIREPESYKEYKIADAIDNMKNGFVRNPVTNNWEKRYDQVTGQQVNYGDLNAAANIWLDTSGMRDKIALAREKAAGKQALQAAGQRDTTLLQMDTSTSDSSVQPMTLEEAYNIANNNQFIREAEVERLMGNTAKSDKVELAMKVLEGVN